MEVEGFLTSVSALVKLMQSEASLLKAVLPERRSAVLSQTEAAKLAAADKAVFEHVVQTAVATVMSESENLDKVGYSEVLLMIIYDKEKLILHQGE